MVLTKLAGTQDLRSIGSGNIGATNVLRTGRKGLAAATLIGDMLKGTIAVIIAGYYGGANAAMLAALGAFLGHLFPVWLKFNGGKGVATYIGVLIGLFWPAALMFCLIWLATAVTTRYSSLSALVAAFVTPLFLWWFGHPALASLFVVLTLLLFWKHSENIKRLAGRDRRADRGEVAAAHVRLGGHQAASSSRVGRIRISAEIPSCSCRRRIISIDKLRLRFMTSATRARVPIKGSRSRRLKPCCSIRNWIASMGSGGSMG